MKKSYTVRTTMPGGAATSLAAHDELMRALLYARGIEDAETAEMFLAPDFMRDSHDPLLLPDMEKAVERILAAVRAGEKIAVWSDYDADGIPGGAMLTEFLRDIYPHGAKENITHYIPHRHDEGYGLNAEGVDELVRGGVSLIITVDLGISDAEHVAHANECGIDVVITDHHLPVRKSFGEGESQEVLPPALAVVDAHRADSEYPFKELCGAGVAWKLIQAILARDRFGYPEGKEKWLLDLVALATLSDMVPLVGENRMLAHYGLLVMRKNRRPGLRALFSLIRMDARTLTETDVVFMVTPRINAASRMDTPELAARMLAAPDDAEGRAYAERLQHLNNERKGLVASITKEARKRLRERGESAQPVIVIGDPSWRPGVLGLVANALVESEGAPAFVWGRHGESALKGSCRSDGSANMVELMGAVSDVLIEFGGHANSGGFSMAEDRAHELAPALCAAHARLASKDDAVVAIEADYELHPSDLSRALRTVSRLAPFGQGNARPLFIFPGLSVSYQKTFGKQGEHVEVGFARDGASAVGVSFFTHVQRFAKTPVENVTVDVVAHIETDFRNRPRLRIVDIL